jgi:hypothetical protein
MRTIMRVLAVSACMLLMGAPLAVAEEVSSDELAEMRAMMEQLQGQVAAQSEQIEHQGEVIKEAQLDRAREDDSRLGASGITSFLQRLEVEGWIAGSYFWNFNNPSKRTQPFGNVGNAGGVYPFHTGHNTFSVDQVWFGLEHPIDEENRAGFRFDLVFGSTAANLGNAPGGRCYNAGDCTSSYYVNQAYIQYLMPFTSNGITMKAGKFGTLAGAEVAQTTANFNITRGNVYNLLQPIDHVGLLFDTEWGETGITTALGFANSGFNGGSADFDVTKGKGVIGQVGWSNETIGSALTVIWSDEVANFGNGPNFGGDDRGVGLLDLVLTWDPTEKISTWLNFDYSWANVGGGTTATALGIAVAGRYAVTERFGISTRFEWVGDDDGFVGWQNPNAGNVVDGNIFSLTGTADYAITNNLMVRGEVRWDTISKTGGSDDEFYGRGSYANVNKSDQVTMGAELVYEF